MPLRSLGREVAYWQSGQEWRFSQTYVTLTRKRNQIPSYIVYISSVLMNRAPPNGFLDQGLWPQRDHIVGIDKFLQLYALSCVSSAVKQLYICADIDGKDMVLTVVH